MNNLRSSVDRIAKMIGFVAVGGLVIVVTRAIWRVALPMALLAIAVNFATYSVNMPEISPDLRFYGSMGIAGIAALFFLILYMGRE